MGILYSTLELHAVPIIPLLPVLPLGTKVCGSGEGVVRVHNGEKDQGHFMVQNGINARKEATGKLGSRCRLEAG